MSLKRRQFLILSGISCFGVIAVGSNLFASQTTQTSDTHSQTPKPTPSTDTRNELADTPLLRFVSIADTGTGAAGQYAVAEAMTAYYQQNPYELVIMAGDNIYNDGEIEKVEAVFEKPYQALLENGVKFHACLGNHDIRTANGDPQVRYPGFNMQGRYYTFRRGSVQFWALDTNANADWQRQLPWLEQELSRSDAPWKIVFGHNPIYSSGHYGLNQAFIETLTPLFQKYGVQLYINGHDHNYERTVPINGTTYLTCGGGAGVRPVGRSSWTAHSASTLSFAAYEVYGDRILIRGIDTKGQIFDQGVIRYDAG
jgi:3',5'-cyclic AMP phosphodiesterase CpdA